MGIVFKDGQPVLKKPKFINKNTLAFSVLTLMAGMILVSQGSTIAATIDQLKAQSNSLQQQIDSNDSAAKQLQSQANTIQNQLAILNLQIATMQSQMQLTQTKLGQLQVSLNNAQNKLNNEKGLLKASLDQLYKMSGASTVELLIGSDSFTQFINEQTYMDSLKNGIQKSAEQVMTLEGQIQAQQTQQQSLLSEQQAQQATLVSTQTQQQTLLSQTQGQEAAYQQMVANLQAQQNAINQEIIAKSKIISGGSGGYPWSNAQPFAGYYSCPGFDPWGFCERSCTSYVAWRVNQVDGDMLSWGMDGLPGNAIDWSNRARMAGIRVSTTPKVDAVANWLYQPYGHVAFVEAVNPDGTVLVSEYNYVTPGKYDERLLTPGVSVMPDDYIYF